MLFALNILFFAENSVFRLRLTCFMIPGNSFFSSSFNGSIIDLYVFSIVEKSYFLWRYGAAIAILCSKLHLAVFSFDAISLGLRVSMISLIFVDVEHLFIAVLIRPFNSLLIGLFISNVLLFCAIWLYSSVMSSMLWWAASKYWVIDITSIVSISSALIFLLFICG